MSGLLAESRALQVLNILCSGHICCYLESRPLSLDPDPSRLPSGPSPRLPPASRAAHETSRRPDAAERRSTPQAPVTAEQVTSGRPNELTRSEARSVSPPDRDRDPARRCRGITRRFSLGQLAWHFMDIFAQRAKRCRLLVYVKRDGRLFVMAPSCTSELTCTKRCSE